MAEAALPVAGLSKAKRIAWSTPQNQISVPFLKMLRERNKTRKVYDVNPYVEVYQFCDNLYGLLNPNLDGGLEVWSWLVQGPGKAMLIGTGFGLGDLKGLATRIAGGKPLIVVNSYSDRDQVLGNCRFERVYCHEHDASAIAQTVQPSAWDSTFDPGGNNRWVQFDRSDLPRYKQYDLTPVKDGHVFNLGGGYEVRVLWTGGHTPGHIMLLDHNGRRLFPGANISSNTMLCGLGSGPGHTGDDYTTLDVYRTQLARVVGRLDQFDYLYPAQGFINLENYVLGDIVDTLDQILAHPDVFNYKRMHTVGGKTVEVREKYVRGFATIGYTQRGVRAGAGLHAD